MPPKPQARHLPAKTALGLALFAALGLASVRPAAAQTHSYDLTKGYTDADGGPSLTPEGGTQNAGGYSFTNNEGLNLSSTLGSDSSYSIELVFSLTGNSSPRNSFQKIIDFKGLTSDDGLYDEGGDLDFFGGAGGNTQVFFPGQAVDILLTRDASGVVTGYAAGTEQFQFTDTGQIGVFSANSIEFFHDDSATSGGESPTGVVQSITLGPAAAPEPPAFAGLALGALGVAGLMLRACRRRTSVA